MTATETATGTNSREPAMAETQGWQELIARLEKATGPERVLDVKIAAHLGTLGGFSAEVNPQPCDRDGNYLPAYTASIDDAITLMPDEDHHWKCGYSKHVPHNAEVRDLMHPHKGVFIGEHDHSRAIALCIAALKARGS